MNNNHQPLDVMFFGAAHMDRLGKTDAPALAGRSNPGQFIERPGGAAFNSASLMAACDLRVGLSTILGSDAGGNVLHSSSKERGITLSAQTGETTASYTAILGPDGDLVVGLADMAIYDDYKAPALNSFRLGVLDANLPEAEITKLLQNGQRFSALATSMAKADRLRQHIGKLDCLFCNVGELRVLTGDDDVQRSLMRFMDEGLERAVVSESGVKLWFAQAGSVHSMPVPQVDGIQDVTGAGDALAALTLTGLLQDLTFKEAVELGLRGAQALLTVDGPYRNDIAAVCGLPMPSH